MAASSRNSYSQVWQYFTKIEEAGETKITCTKCEAVIKAKQSSTTNLHTHLKRKHNIAVSKLEPTTKKNKPTTVTAEDKTSSSSTTTLTKIWTKLPQSSHRHQAITNSIAKYVILDLRPLDSVNNSGFLQLLTTLEPRYDVTSRTHITQQVIPKIYTEIKANLQQKISNSEFFALTTDGWTSRSNKSFVTITLHVLSNDWQMNDYVLSTHEVVDSHTSEFLSKDFEQSSRVED
jgi:hypothetical protein